jgi:hypothetical protein
MGGFFFAKNGFSHKGSKAQKKKRCFLNSLCELVLPRITRIYTDEYKK